jgi:hypothetical protein
MKVLHRFIDAPHVFVHEVYGHYGGGARAAVYAVHQKTFRQVQCGVHEVYDPIDVVSAQIYFAGSFPIKCHVLDAHSFPRAWYIRRCAVDDPGDFV